MLKLSFRKQLGNFRLEVNHTIAEKVSAIFGPSGSGKSTLLNCISGILHPDEGKLSFDDQTLYASKQKVQLPPEKRGFGYVFQEGHLFPHLTVQKNILYGRSYRSQSRSEINPELVIDILEIGDLLTHYPYQLSGGQRQRVATARALTMCPRMLLMDEPLASLDLGLKNRILPYLYHIKQVFDIPILYVTHSVSEAIALADEVFWLSDGRIIAHGEPYKLLMTPSALPLAQLTGVENVLSLPIVASHERRGVTELAFGTQKLFVSYTQAKVGDLVPVGIRAQDIIVATDRHLPISARNILSGTIRQIADQGGRVMLSVDVEDHLLSVGITSEGLNALTLMEGMVCYIIIKASAINLLWEA